MDQNFIEPREAGFYLKGSRVPLDCVVREYKKGESPEVIRAHYPTLTLEQIYGAIAFYLGHQKEVDGVIAERERVEDTFREVHPTPPQLKKKFEQIQHRLSNQRT